MILSFPCEIWFGTHVLLARIFAIGIVCYLIHEGEIAPSKMMWKYGNRVKYALKLSVFGLAAAFLLFDIMSAFEIISIEGLQVGWIISQICNCI